MILYGIEYWYLLRADKKKRYRLDLKIKGRFRASHSLSEYDLPPVCFKQFNVVQYILFVVKPFIKSTDDNMITSVTVEKNAKLIFVFLCRVAVTLEGMEGGRMGMVHQFSNRLFTLSGM